MEASRKPISLAQRALQTKAQNKHISDYFEKRSFPLVSRAKQNVRKITETILLAVGQRRCRKFVFA